MTSSLGNLDLYEYDSNTDTLSNLGQVGNQPPHRFTGELIDSMDRRLWLITRTQGISSDFVLGLSDNQLSIGTFNTSSVYLGFEDSELAQFVMDTSVFPSVITGGGVMIRILAGPNQLPPNVVDIKSDLWSISYTGEPGDSISGPQGPQGPKGTYSGPKLIGTSGISGLVFPSFTYTS